MSFPTVVRLLDVGSKTPLDYPDFNVVLAVGQGGIMVPI